jgi:quercetin dioxygenase-like cupin family protein
MVEEARLESVASGLAPVSPGWFVVNARDAAWVSNDRHGGVCIFESDEFVLRGRPDLEEYVKPGAGFVIRVVMPGQPTGGYHAESVEEDFLVVFGECILIIEEQERRLRTWDFVHCPPGTAHTFVGAGDGPCVLVCAGNRDFDDETFWRESRPSEVARRYGASGDNEPPPAGTWKVERPDTWPQLPWTAARR